MLNSVIKKEHVPIHETTESMRMHAVDAADSCRISLLLFILFVANGDHSSSRAMSNEDARKPIDQKDQRGIQHR